MSFLTSAVVRWPCSTAYLMPLTKKLEYWNCVLDAALKHLTGGSVFKTRDFLELLTGLPVLEESPATISLLSEFLQHYSKFALFMETKTECYFVLGVKAWLVGEEQF